MERALVRPTLQQADRDADGQLSRDEVATALRKLFETCAGPGTPAIEQKRLTAALEKIVPAQPAGRGPGGFVSPAAAIALSRGIFALAGKDGQLTADALVAAGAKLFDQSDADKSGKLDSRELTSALKTVLTPPAPPDPTKARAAR
jgi:Ca2+-binding EF-hand superfamily protein